MNEDCSFRCARRPTCGHVRKEPGKVVPHEIGRSGCCRPVIGEPADPPDCAHAASALALTIATERLNWDTPADAAGHRPTDTTARPTEYAASPTSMTARRCPGGEVACKRTGYCEGQPTVRVRQQFARGSRRSFLHAGEDTREGSSAGARDHPGATATPAQRGNNTTAATWILSRMRVALWPTR